MNQRADSRKKNLAPIVAKPLINQQGWLLSHTWRFFKSHSASQRLAKSRNRIEKAFAGPVARFFFGRSARGGLGRLPGFVRPGADRLSRGHRPDAERPASGDRRDRGLRRPGPEERPALRAELRFVADHADRDAVDIGDLVGFDHPETRSSGGLRCSAAWLRMAA